MALAVAHLLLLVMEALVLLLLLVELQLFMLAVVVAVCLVLQIPVLVAWVAVEVLGHLVEAQEFLAERILVVVLVAAQVLLMQAAQAVQAS
jgi:hypothetical protein